jgi:hypothetical protein
MSLQTYWLVTPLVLTGLSGFGWLALWSRGIVRSRITIQTVTGLSISRPDPARDLRRDFGDRSGKVTPQRCRQSTKARRGLH